MCVGLQTATSRETTLENEHYNHARVANLRLKGFVSKETLTPSRREKENLALWPYSKDYTADVSSVSPSFALSKSFSEDDGNGEDNARKQ